MRKSRPSVLACHRTAKALLRGRKGVCFSVFALLVLCALAFLGVLFVCAVALCAFYRFDQPTLYLGIALAGLLPLWLIFAPLWEGLLAFFYRLSRGGVPRLADVFSFFCDGKRYRYALLRFVCRLARVLFFLATFFLVAVLGQGVAAYLVSKGDLNRASLVVGGTLFFLFLLLVMGVRFAYRPYLMGAAFFSVPSLSHRSVGAVSATAMRHRYGKVILLDASFFPLFVFSFLLLGIPLIFLIPRFLAARAEMCFSLLALERT